MNRSSESDHIVLAATAVEHGFTVPHGTLSILRDIHLRVKAGESLAVLGPSGSGKSTLLGLLAGLDRPSGGRIEMFGTRIDDLDEDGRAALRAGDRDAGGVGFVFQSFQLLPALTALENVRLPLELSGNRDADARARDWLGRVGLGDRLDHFPRQLSGGEQQRVALARAFAGDPALLFADEPTGNLDRATGAHVAELMFSLQRERGVTLVLVTHDENLAAQCDRRVRIDGGELRESA
ncbi:MAG: ABC transporter ATP-binding protein [Chromatiales bacterium]|nr:ABC transporter ATP-binding protein [Gammaproteobacteria bacterium]MCP5353059.1 ABC transporter ATP-binding protein [Chromatiales bacterium]